MKHGVAEEQKSCVFRFWRFACTHTPPSFSSLYKQARPPGASFIKTGRRVLQWLPGHIPVCCQMSCVKPRHFTRRPRTQTRTTDASEPRRHTQMWSFKGAFLTSVKPWKIVHRPTPQKVITCQWDVKISPRAITKHYVIPARVNVGRCPAPAQFRGLHNLVPGIV